MAERMSSRRVLRRIVVSLLLATGVGVATHTPALAVDVATTTTLAATPSPSVFGQAVTLTATVSGGATGGTVTFKDGATSLGDIALASGSAALTVSSLAAGPHTLTASYSGATGFTPSTSAGRSHKVTRASTSTAVVSSLNPSIVGDSVTFTATVSVVAPGAGVPTGSVEFKDGSRSLATVPLTAGSASHTTTELAAGNHGIIGVYSGDANFFLSRAATVSQKVERPSITITAPAAGTSWARGTTQNITWTYTDAPGSAVRIRLFKAATSQGDIVVSAPIGTNGAGSFAWAIPATLKAAETYRIEVIVIGAAPAVSYKTAAFTLT